MDDGTGNSGRDRNNTNVTKSNEGLTTVESHDHQRSEGTRHIEEKVRIDGWVA